MKIPVKPSFVVKKDTMHPLLKYLLIAFFIIAVFHNFFGAIAYNSFVFIDNSLRSYGANSPLVMWVFLGVCFGLLLGAFVAYRKYQLNRRVVLMVVFPVSIVICAMFFNNMALQSIPFDHHSSSIGIENPVDIDSIQQVVDSVKEANMAVLRRKYITEKKKSDAGSTIGCADQTSLVCVTVRSDSLTLFFRISNAKDGDWGDWEEIKIPQPGKYLLTGERGKVNANSIQYYYQVGSTLTRSAGNPFFKSICSGELTLDTY